MTRNIIRSATLAVFGAVALAGHAGAQAARGPAPKLTEAEARTIALREVPNGRVESSELEREHGHLIYSFDIKVAGKKGVEEVNVDALNGKVLAHEHEGPAAERKEKASEAREKPVG